MNLHTISINRSLHLQNYLFPQVLSIGGPEKRESKREKERKREREKERKREKERERERKREKKFSNRRH